MLARLLIMWALAVLALPVLAHGEERGPLSAQDAVSLARRIMPASKDARGWGEDVMRALDQNGINPTRSNFCSVMAVIGQESTFTANPEVKGLGALAEKEIMRRLSDLPLGIGAVHGARWFLANRPSPQKSYLTLIRAARTERDLDLVFRNMSFYMFRELAATGLLRNPTLAKRVDAINPVSTLGSMQVSAAYAIAEVEKARRTRLGTAAIWKLRDELYTRQGGVNYGTRMLLGYRAGYASRLYVFADYNAGRYASRNAAFQHMVAELSGKPLALDGDLLIYEGKTPTETASATEKALRGLKLGQDDKALRADLLSEKDYAFRDTTIYASVADAFRRKTGKQPPYAMLPQITLKSPKIRHSMTTAIFARAVMGRYELCMRSR